MGSGAMKSNGIVYSKLKKMSTFCKPRKSGGEEDSKKHQIPVLEEFEEETPDHERHKGTIGFHKRIPVQIPS